MKKVFLLILFLFLLEMTKVQEAQYLSKITEEEYVCFFYDKKMTMSPVEIHLEAEIDQKLDFSTFFFEIIFEKNLNKEKCTKDESSKDSYILRFVLSKENKIKDSLKIEKCLEENEECSINEAQVKFINSGDALYDISVAIDYDEIKIFSKKDIIFEDKAKLRNYFGDGFYLKVVSAKKGIKFKTISFTSDTTNLRLLEENEGKKLVHLEMDPINIETQPNYLREGDIYVLPKIILNPKNGNGDFPSDIENYSKMDFKKLFNVTHSNGGNFVLLFALKDTQLTLSVLTETPGELYLSSNYFENKDTYIMKIKNGEIKVENTLAKRIKEQFSSDNSVRLQIIPKDKYGRKFKYLEQSDLDKFQISIKYPDNTTTNEESSKLKFDQDSQSIIFDKNLTMAGETTFEIKINNQTIECFNCTANPTYNEIDFNNSNITYPEEIELGENISLTFSPKDIFNNIIPAKEIFDTLTTDCLLNNKTKIEIDSSCNEENNIIEIKNKDIINEPGNITFILSYKNKIIEFKAQIIEKPILENTKFYLKTNMTLKEINNNSIINISLENEFDILISLRNLYGNELRNKDESIIIKEPKLYGNDMDMILFDTINNKTEVSDFNLTIPEENKEDFRYLVSGDNYSIELELLNDNNNSVTFYFNTSLTSLHNDTGYGNGKYNVTHFTIAPNETPYKMEVGNPITFNLELRTTKDLLYHKELDINEYLKYNLSIIDKSFNLTGIKEDLGIYKIQIFSTYACENELTLIFDDIEYENKIILNIEAITIPDVNNSQLVFATSIINEDVDPIEIHMILRDMYNNTITAKSIEYKKQLFIMSGDEKPEQNIIFDEGNKTYILRFVSDYHKELFNLSVVFNNTNNLTVFADNIIVKLNVTTFAVPEQLVSQIKYKTGFVFIYKSQKMLKSSIQVHDNIQEQDLETIGDFIFYIRDKFYEKGENNTKLVYYSGYLSILNYIFKNNTSEELLINDKILANIYNNIKNNQTSNYLPNNEDNRTISFIKIEFYENGYVKSIQYPKHDNFSLRYMDFINPMIDLIIPQISSKLYSDEDIFAKMNQYLNNQESNNNKTNLLRRLAELTKQNK